MRLQGLRVSLLVRLQGLRVSTLLPLNGLLLEGATVHGRAQAQRARLPPVRSLFEEESHTAAVRRVWELRVVLVARVEVIEREGGIRGVDGIHTRRRGAQCGDGWRGALCGGAQPCVLRRAQRTRCGQCGGSRRAGDGRIVAKACRLERYGKRFGGAPGERDEGRIGG